MIISNYLLMFSFHFCILFYFKQFKKMTFSYLCVHVAVFVFKLFLIFV